MASDPHRPYVDAQSMTDDEAHLYEAVAALEYLGRPAIRTEIAAAAGLDDAALETALRTLTTRRALIRTGTGKDAVYEPAAREWSVVPSEP